MSNRNLIEIIKNKIDSNNGHIDIEQFMNEVLYNHNCSFYPTIDNLNLNLIGKNGHFITSPEISQVFGELIALWIIDFCQKEKFEKVTLIELGPGKGTLMSDILRIIKKFNIKTKFKICFLETSKNLKNIQKKVLSKNKINKNWFDNFEDLKLQLDKQPSIFIANEFFDCLPIQQFKLNKKTKIWEKLCIKIKNDKLIFDTTSSSKKEQEIIKIILEKFSNYKGEKTFIEYSNAITELVTEISKIVYQNDGTLLIIDYGKENPFGNTLQSVWRHKKSSLLTKIGYSDYSSLIDFSNIKNISTKQGLQTYKLISQRDFLLSLGIKNRTEILSYHLQSAEKKYFLSSIERLISKIYMGDVFNVFCTTKGKKKLLSFNN